MTTRDPFAETKDSEAGVPTELPGATTSVAASELAAWVREWLHDEYVFGPNDLTSLANSWLSQHEEIARLREMICRQSQSYQALEKQRQVYVYERDELREKLRRVEELHVSSPFQITCNHCGNPWPCATRRAIEWDHA